MALRGGRGWYRYGGHLARRPGRRIRPCRCYRHRYLVPKEPRASPNDCGRAGRHQNPLEPGKYDLIHAKTLLQHVAERDRVLREFAEALRPGGYLVIEDADIRSIQRVEPPSPLLTRAAAALETFFYFSGADPAYPMRLMSEVRKVGLEVLGTDAQVTAVQAGTDAIETVRMSLEKLAPMIVKAGLMGQVEIDKALKLLADDGETMIYTSTTIAVWARRPGA